MTKQGTPGCFRRFRYSADWWLLEEKDALFRLVTVERLPRGLRSYDAWSQKALEEAECPQPLDAGQAGRRVCKSRFSLQPAGLQHWGLHSFRILDGAVSNRYLIRSSHAIILLELEFSIIPVVLNNLWPEFWRWCWHRDAASKRPSARGERSCSKLCRDRRSAEAGLECLRAFCSLAGG